MEIFFWVIMGLVVLISKLAAKPSDSQEGSAGRLRVPRRSRVERFERLAKKLANGEVERNYTRQKLRVSGKVHGRAVRLTARKVHDPLQALKYAVAFTGNVHFHAARSSRQGLDGYHIRNTFVPEEERLRLRQVANDERVRRHLGVLFREFDCLEVWVGDGWITAKRKDVGFLSSPANTLRMFDRLSQLARAFEATGVERKVKATARPAETQTCPYCRDVFSPSEALVACASCSTVHHDECFRELGRCTSMGCGSTQASPYGQAATAEEPEEVVDITPCFFCGEAFRGCTAEECKAPLRDQRRQARRRALQRRRIRSDQWQNMRRRF